MKYLVFTLLMSVSAVTFADDDQSAPTIAREPAVHVGEKASARQYPGGRDEQDLKIQPSLPQPTRNIDGSPVVGELAVPDDHDD